MTMLSRAEPAPSETTTSGLPRLLMIDNNRGDLELIRIAFDEAEIPVSITCAESGAEGQMLLGRVSQGIDAPYVLTLLDLNMPGKNGHDVLTWARAQPTLLRATIVILTSSGSQSDRRRCLAEGASDVLVKPATFGAVLTLVLGLRSYLYPESHTA